MGHGWGAPPARFNKGAGGAEAGIGIRGKGGQKAGVGSLKAFLITLMPSPYLWFFLVYKEKLISNTTPLPLPCECVCLCVKTNPADQI